MSSTPNTVIVKILDKDFQVACPPEQQSELLDAARQLDAQMRKIRETGKVVGLERIAVMAALNNTYDLMQVQDKLEAQPNSDESLRQLNNKVDKALQRLKQLEI